MTTKKPDNKTFEETMEELEKIVEEVEQGQIPLEECLARYERGMKLKQYCQKILDEAEKRIEVISRQDKKEKKNDPAAPKDD